MKKYLIILVCLLFPFVAMAEEYKRCIIKKLPPILCDGYNGGAGNPDIRPVLPTTFPIKISSVSFAVHIGNTQPNAIAGLLQLFAQVGDDWQTRQPILQAANQQMSGYVSHVPPILVNSNENLKIAYGCATRDGYGTASLNVDMGICWIEDSP